MDDAGWIVPTEHRNLWHRKSSEAKILPVGHFNRINQLHLRKLRRHPGQAIVQQAIPQSLATGDLQPKGAAATTAKPAAPPQPDMTNSRS